jgi:hypothetical protein
MGKVGAILCIFLKKETPRIVNKKAILDVSKMAFLGVLK